jgi:hypothetical protein
MWQRASDSGVHSPARQGSDLQAGAALQYYAHKQCAQYPAGAHRPHVLPAALAGAAGCSAVSSRTLTGQQRRVGHSSSA